MWQACKALNTHYYNSYCIWLPRHCTSACCLLVLFLLFLLYQSNQYQVMITLQVLLEISPLFPHLPYYIYWFGWYNCCLLSLFAGAGFSPLLEFFSFHLCQIWVFISKFGVDIWFYLCVYILLICVFIK